MPFRSYIQPNSSKQRSEKCHILPHLHFLSIPLLRRSLVVRSLVTNILFVLSLRQERKPKCEAMCLTLCLTLSFGLRADFLTPKIVSDKWSSINVNFNLLVVLAYAITLICVAPCIFVIITFITNKCTLFIL